jgi:polyisoprenoid-binding protein YceI
MLQHFLSVGTSVGRVRTLVCLLIVFALAPAGQAQTFEIDNDHTSLVFAVSHSGLSYTYGRFNKCSGQISIGKTEKDQSFLFSIDAKSIDTNNPLRDDHLKGPDFFDVLAFPEIEFRSARLSNDGDDFTAEGTLTLHGIKKDVTIKMTKIGIGKGPRGKTRVGFFSKFSVKRSDFGITSLPTIIGNEIAITLSFEAILKAQKPGGSAVKTESGPLDAGGLQEEFGVLEP